MSKLFARLLRFLRLVANDRRYCYCHRLDPLVEWPPTIDAAVVFVADDDGDDDVADVLVTLVAIHDIARATAPWFVPLPLVPWKAPPKCVRLEPGLNHSLVTREMLWCCWPFHPTRTHSPKNLVRDFVVGVVAVVVAPADDDYDPYHTTFPVALRAAIWQSTFAHDFVPGRMNELV